MKGFVGPLRLTEQPKHLRSNGFIAHEMLSIWIAYALTPRMHPRTAAARLSALPAATLRGDILTLSRSRSHTASSFGLSLSD